jgi:hypothetical protein
MAFHPDGVHAYVLNELASTLNVLPKTQLKARRVHLVLGKTEHPLRKSFEDVLVMRAATKLLRRIEFHHTPSTPAG